MYLFYTVNIVVSFYHVKYKIQNKINYPNIQ